MKEAVSLPLSLSLSRPFRPSLLTNEMNISSFFAFAALFFAASSGLMVSVIQLNNESPWTLDDVSNRGMLGIPDGMSLEEWIGGDKQSVLQFFQMLYRFAALCLLFGSLLLYIILFFGAYNRGLIIATQAATIGWLVHFGFWLRAYGENSVHVRLYAAVAVSNIFGMILYIPFGTRYELLKKKKTR